jgi:hypothetical protein
VPMLTCVLAMKAFTASCVFNTIITSVSSPPNWKPHPRPDRAMAEGADQVPSSDIICVKSTQVTSTERGK